MKINKNQLEIEFLAIRDQLESYLYRLSTNKQDVEDLVQDTYIKVQDKISTFKGKSTFKTWAFAIATNLAKDNLRVKDRWRLEAQDDCKNASLSNLEYQNRIITSFQNQTEQKFQLKEHINYCFTCVAKNLKIEQQITIILKELYHFKRIEIAKIIGKTEGVVKHLLFEGRKGLQKRYQKRCALINKKGVCYQCAELNDFLQDIPDSKEKILLTNLKESNTANDNLDIRFNIINKINPLNSKASELEDIILQILREVIKD